MLANSMMRDEVIQYLNIIHKFYENVYTLLSFVLYKSLYFML